MASSRLLPRLLLMVVGSTMFSTALSCHAPSWQSDAPEGIKAILSGSGIRDSILHAQKIEVYSLTGESAVLYFTSDGRRLTRYPVQKGPIEYDQRLIRDLVNLLVDPNAYETNAQLGTGIPRWDAMISFYTEKRRVDILLWTKPGLARILDDQEAVGGGWFDKKLSEVKNLVDEVTTGSPGLQGQAETHRESP